MADVSEKKTVGCPPPSWGSADKTHHTHTHTHTHTHDQSPDLPGAERALLWEAQGPAPGGGLRSSRNTDPDWWAHPSSEGPACEALWGGVPGGQEGTAGTSS